MLPKSLSNNYLIIVFVLTFGIAKAQTACTEIKATIEVFQSGQKSEKASVSIDFKDQSQSSFSVFLFGIKGLHKKNIEGDEIKDLDRGKYLLVFTSRREEEGFCMKQVEFTIK
jgi:hypothetical protein